MGRIIIKRGDITREEVDVIVNAANEKLCVGGGVDGAIHRAAGSSVIAECGEIGGCLTGGAVITNAGNLKAKKIIHTVGPVWHGGHRGEAVKLAECYSNSFKLAKENGLKTIAFPAISTGVFGYPIEKATWIAVEEGLRFQHDFDEIRYICFSDSDYRVYKRVHEELTKI